MAWFDDDEFDPQTHAGQSGGGLLGRLLAVNPGLMPRPSASGAEAPSALPQPPSASQTNTVTTDEDGRPLRRIYITSPATPVQSTGAQDGPVSSDILSSANSPYGAPTYDSQGGLLGRLLALQAEQSRYQPTPDSDAHPSIPQTGNSPSLAAPRATTSPSSAAGVELDPIDIGKSLGAGVANGVISGAGFPADVLTGFGYLSPHLLENSFRRILGYSDLSPDEQGLIDTFTSDALRHDFENHVVPLHQPETRLGRYAETIGEMLPVLLSGETLGARVWGALRGVQSAAGTPMRELPATVLQHAVLPGAVVQTIEEEFPESKVGKTLQKVYPIARKAVPYVPAITRYLGKRIVPY